MSVLLPEIGERDATGALADVYDDIRRTLGLPVVNLVYRHLATRPGRLEAIWDALRPVLADRRIEGAVADLQRAVRPPEPAAIPAAAVLASGIGEDELVLVAPTLDAYDRANASNVIALLALLGPASAATADPGPSAGRAVPMRVARLLPMAALDGLERPVMRLLTDMSAPLARDGEALLIPSLLRHFAHRPCLLALVWTSLRPALEGISPQADELHAHAHALARPLARPAAVALTDAERAVLERFARAMPHMLVYAAAMRAALQEVLR